MLAMTNDCIDFLVFFSNSRIISIILAGTEVRLTCMVQTVSIFFFLCFVSVPCKVDLSPSAKKTAGSPKTEKNCGITYVINMVSV